MTSRFPILLLILVASCLISFLTASGAAEPFSKESRNDWGWASTSGGRGGRILRVTNLKASGPDTNEGVPLFHFGGSGPLELYMEDNLILNRDGERENPPLLVSSGGISKKCKVLKVRPSWPERLEPRPASEVEAYVLENAGARPWDRDEVDRHLVRKVRQGTGRIIDSEKEVGGYSKEQEKRPGFRWHGHHRWTAICFAEKWQGCVL